MDSVLLTPSWLSLSRCSNVSSCARVCVCVRETDRQTDRERERECVYVCVCVLCIFFFVVFKAMTMSLLRRCHCNDVTMMSPQRAPTPPRRRLWCRSWRFSVTLATTSTSSTCWELALWEVRGHRLYGKSQRVHSSHTNWFSQDILKHRHTFQLSIKRFPLRDVLPDPD